MHRMRVPEKQPHSAGSRGHGNQLRLGECGNEVTSWRDIEKAGRKVTAGRVQLGYERAPRTERERTDDRKRREPQDWL